MNIEIVLGVICVILLFIAWETIKLKKKEKENEQRKQQKTGSPRKGNRKANRTSGKATSSK